MKLAFLILCSALVAPVMASSLSSQLSACVKISDGKERLACFDQAMATTKTVAAIPEKKATPPVNVAAEPAETKPLTKAENFGQEHKQVSQGLDQLELTIASIKKNSYGQYRLVSENNQVWQQKDSSHLKLRVGDKVIIKRGALSSFYLKKPESNRSIKVKRIK
ncbi:hypothetical protein [Thalassotalea sp. PLHSN55]|uniref:hypothetical protein n=1 Tax=Thalassotalea sp. PLHSN55 TaxID=3435888 RepID=UPI003F834F5C